MVRATNEANDSSQIDDETAHLTISVLDTCANRDSTIVLGALFWVIEALLEQCPDRGYAIACADHMERTGREIRKRLTS